MLLLRLKDILLFTIVLHYCSNQGTWTWPDGSSFSWTNWWTGECWLFVGWDFFML